MKENNTLKIINISNERKKFLKEITLNILKKKIQILHE